MVKEQKDPNENYENILEAIGGFGRYQFLSFICITLGITFYSSILTFMVFGGAEAPKKEVDAYCNGTSQTLNFPYRSIMKEWNLTKESCTHKTLASFPTTMQMIGGLAGAIFVGPLSDRLGRRSVLIASFILTTILQTLVGFSPNYKYFVAGRFFLGFVLQLASAVHYVYFVETTVQRWRMLNYLPGYPVGYVIAALLGYLANDWRKLTWISLFPCPLVLAMLLFYFEESPIWLTDRKNTEKAEKALLFIAKQNGQKTDENIQKISAFLTAKRKHAERDTHEPKTYYYWHLFTRRRLAISTIAVAFVWLGMSSVYFSLLFGTSNLAGNLALNLAIPMLIRSFCSLFVVLADRFIPKMGRRTILYVGVVWIFVCMFLSLLFSAIGSLSDETRKIGVRATSLIGLGGMALIWPGADTLGAETFPTQLRVIGNSFCCVFNRIGSVIAPSIVSINRTWAPGPYVISLIFVLLTALDIFLFVPETKGRDLPTLHEDQVEEE